MTDTEVENTLREIRERVRAEASALDAPRPGVPASPTAADAPPADAGSDARARLEANLSTLERAWDRLPPVTSYRTGPAARVELWVKRQLRRATHWFTWEQVNFNAATLAALRDTLAGLAALASQSAAYEQALAELRAETEARLNALEQNLPPGLDRLRSEIEAVRDEQRERLAHLGEEYRVGFRQLSLEASELAVALDRARRGADARLERLEKTVTRDG